MNDFRESLRGIIAMLVSCLCFILNDTFVKIIGDDLPLGQIIALRGVFATAALLAFGWYVSGLGGFRAHLSRPVVLRTIGEVVATLLFLSALMHLPLANISSIMQAVPLAITAAAALFLGERVGWRRWTAIIVGFLGILLIVRPGAEGFNLWALVALCAVLLVTLRDMSTRMIPPTTPTLAIALIASASVMMAGFALSLTEDWQPVSLREGAMLLGSGIFLLIGFVTVIIAMRHGDVAIVAPFRYSFIPYAILIGWLVWGDVPDALTMVGIAVVIGTGVYTFYRERRLAREKEALQPGPAAGSRIPGAAR
jgi:drug/metabolite transporter (DMT)-like permease